jgi:insulysin
MPIGQNDATHVKPLTKADIQEFYKTYVSPSSAKRARISVHLHARETGELDTKIIELLKQTSLDNVPAEQRQNLDLLEKYLKEEAKLAADQVSTILKQVEEHGLKPAAPNRGSASMVDGTAAVKKATAITDIRLFQGGLLSSQGPHSNRDLGEFENINPIL